MCNDLFSRFEQQTLILKKQAETTDPTTDRHGHDGPSRGSCFKTLRKTENWVLKSDSLNFVTKWQDGPSQARRPVTGCTIPVWVGFLCTF